MGVRYSVHESYDGSKRILKVTDNDGEYGSKIEQIANIDTIDGINYIEFIKLVSKQDLEGIIELYKYKL